MENRKTRDARYLEMARILAENSKAEKKKVGALIVKNETIIGDGYNGTPSGFDNICEYEYLENGQKTLKTKKEVLHAESNAIAKIARSNNSSDGATIYITLSPCLACAKLIIQAGIKRVVFNEAHTETDGLELLKRAKIAIKKIT